MPAELVLIFLELVLMRAEAVDKVVLMPRELVLMRAEAVDKVVLMPRELVLIPFLADVEMV